MASANKPGEAYRLLDPFVGKWNTEGIIRQAAKNPAIIIRGTDVYEWLPGGFFLLHKVDVHIGNDRNESIGIIGFDKLSNSYPMRHYDNKGNTGLMHARVNNGVWIFLGESLRFTGGFSENGTILSGSWEQSADGKNWEHFIDIMLIKFKY